MRDYDISQRRASRFVCVDPRTVRRERSPDCAEIPKEMQEIAGKRRRIDILLAWLGMIMTHKKFYRIYRKKVCR